MTLDVYIDGDKCWPDLIDEQGNPNFVEGKLTSIARLVGGTVNGKSSVTVRIELPDGQTVLAQTTLALIGSAIDAFRIADTKEQQ